MKIAVILINWNGWKDTVSCISSLKKARLYNHCEILVVDNGSQDPKEAAYIQNVHSDVTIWRNPTNRGFTGANNQGFIWAVNRKASHILLLNNDTIVTEHFLQPLIALALSNPKSIVGPKILFYNSGRIQNIGGKFNNFLGGRNWKKNSPNDRYTKRYLPDYISGCSWLMPITALRDIGFLDNDFFAYCEDLDYSVRARRAGYTLIIDGSSSIYHKHSSSRPPGIKHFLIPRNHILYLKKNGIPMFIQLLSIIPLCLVQIISCRNVNGIRMCWKGIRDGLLAKSGIPQFK